MIRVAKICVLVSLVATLLSMAFQVVVVPTASMERTVLVGDHLLIDRFAYGPEIPFTHFRLRRLKKVQRGDVVSFHPPGRPGEVYLKRVVAIGGDRVEIREGELYLDGEPAVEPYIPGAKRKAWMEAIVVPHGELFMLGDNRDRSEDSRYFGPVPEKNVIGEPVMVLWSFAIPTREWLRPQVAAYFDHPVERLRWGRLFRPVK